MNPAGQIPQTKPIDPRNPRHVQNTSGGYVWKVDDLERLRRFLILGTEQGKYNVNDKTVKVQEVQCIKNLIKNGQGTDAVNLICDVSLKGQAAKQGPGLLALALCCRQTTCINTKRMAYNVLSDVCRIPTFLFQFVEYCEQLSKDGSGWGRAHRKAIGNWYLKYEQNERKEGKPEEKKMKELEMENEEEEKTGRNPFQPLAMHVTKYKQREGWSHKDLLRLAHPKPSTSGVKVILMYVIKGLQAAKKNYMEGAPDNVLELFEYLQAVEDVKRVTDAQECVQLITRHGLVREHVPTNLLSSIEVWSAMLPKMPMTAMIRNLGKMTNIGLLSKDSDAAKLVVKKLSNEHTIRSSRIHPFAILVALRTYSKGEGDKGSLKWTPIDSVKDALDGAFYKAFRNVTPTGKKFCLAIDVSGSMTWDGCFGNPNITPRDASGAMAMVTLHTEEKCEILGFSHKMVNIPLEKSQKLDAVLDTIGWTPMGATDCAQPMLWALENKREVDIFIVYTDNETYFGKIHPTAAMEEYRRKMNKPHAKLLVCGMQANDFTIADPDDPFMLDMVGFDSAAPQIISDFAMNEGRHPSQVNFQMNQGHQPSQVIDLH